MNRYERYKDSGIPWLGEVPEHWNIIQFRRVVENIKDGTHGTHSRENNGFPLLSAKNVFNDGIHIHDNESQISEEDYKLITSNGFPRKNDLLITCVGSIGRCCVYPFDNPIAFQRSVAFLRLNKNSVPQFYKYFVESICYQEQLRANIKLSIQGGVYLGTLVSLYVSLPPQKEQTAIAHYLDTKLGEIDALIEKQQTLLEKLAEQRTAVITHAVTKGLNPAAPMKMSGVEWLGDVPAHWEVKRLKFLITELRVGPFGSAIKISDYVQDGKPLYNQRTVLDNSFANNSIFLTDEKYKELNSFQTKSGDFLLTTRGTIGKVAIVPQNAEPGIIHPCLIRFKIDENLFQPKLLKSIFNETDFFKKQLDLQSNATTIDVIYSNSLKELFLTLPPRDEQAVIADYLDQETTKIDRLCDTVNQTIGRLKEYRTALITQAVTGKIKVTDE
nr:restriction endonuclease subunit S [uncultured Haemophilus sp.]